MTARAAAAALLGLLLLAGCDREDRDVRKDRVASHERQEVVLSSLSPGRTGPHARNTGKGAAYEGNAYEIAQGKRLFVWFNCNGCHGMGGGGSGPALMDDKWIYGSDIANVVATIEEGRPNGMPSFRGKIPDNEIWELAAFVRSMGREVRKDIAPARNDDLNARPAENRLPFAQPQPGGITPPAGEGRQ